VGEEEQVTPFDSQPDGRSLRAGAIAAISLLVLLAGCGKSDESSKGSVGPGKVEPPPRKPPPEVMLGVSVNSNTSAEVFAGWPVVVEAVLRLTPDAKGAKTVTGSSGPWSVALKLSCTGPDGKEVAAEFKPAFASKPSIELTEERSGLAVWILDEVKLPAGTYSLRVTVDASRVGNALPDDLCSNHATLTVSAAAPGPGAAYRKCHATIDAALYKGDAAKALAAAEEHLAAHPKDMLILARKASILRSQGKRTEAMAALEAALKLTEEAKGDVRPLLGEIDDLRQEMRGK
jgi:hypothetical protein